MKNFVVLFLLTMIAGYISAQNTQFKQTNQQFKNGEYVWNVVYKGNVVGEFWPVRGINLVTNQTNPELFAINIPLDNIVKRLGGVATAPDGMTKGIASGFILEGKCLANGIPCGDGNVYNYGIIVVDNGFKITFTHNLEINNFDMYYQSCFQKKATLFFLPSIYRNGKSLKSTAGLDKALVRRETKLKKNGWKQEEQIGVILFNSIMSYNDIKNIILGLDRSLSYATSKTTHIYALDGGPSWGQSCKEVNGVVKTMGTRDPSIVTNYLVFY